MCNQPLPGGPPLNSALVNLPPTLGDFQLLRELGRGGMGVVFEARQISLNRRVALKVLAATLGLDAATIHRFRREAEAAAKLHHTNIVPIYATGEQQGVHFYAMELIEGPSLDSCIRRLVEEKNSEKKPTKGQNDTARSVKDAQSDTVDFTPREPAPVISSWVTESESSLASGTAYFEHVAKLIAEVADALGYAHDQGVIHRDIKPSNLLMAPSGKLSVTDFGLARVLEQPGMTITGELLGTPRYMSPEQITAGRVPVDHRTDIYSLGVTLYELLAFCPPFETSQRDQLFASILQKEPPPPRRINPKTPIDLETICLKAMDKDPDRRYATASQMADDLRRYVNRFEILARRTGPMRRLAKWARRNPANSAAWAVIFAAVIIIAGLAYRSNLIETRRLKEVAEHQIELLNEQRRSALEKAHLFARLEDFSAAEAAIEEAEKLECSKGELLMLRGQVAFYRGDTADALDLLDKATDELPDSVAAWSLFAAANNQTGHLADAGRAIRMSLSKNPSSAEDFLFQGHALAISDPEHALRLIEKGVAQRPSTLASLIRVDIERMLILDYPNLKQTKLTMEDARMLNRQLPGNELVHVLNCSVYLSCFHCFGRLGETELKQEALRLGLENAERLKQLSRTPNAVAARWQFLRETNQPGVDLDEMREAAKQHPNALGFLAIYQYRCGEYENAANLLASRSGDQFDDFLRVLCLAEVGGDLSRANALLNEITDRKLSSWDRYNRQLLLRFVGRLDDATTECQSFLEVENDFPPDHNEAFCSALKYGANLQTEAELIKEMKGRGSDLCNAHFTIGLTELAKGNRQDAISHFRLSRATGVYEYVPYNVSSMLISRMEKDASWPPWVPTGE